MRTSNAEWMRRGMLYSKVGGRWSTRRWPNMTSMLVLPKSKRIRHGHKSTMCSQELEVYGHRRSVTCSNTTMMSWMTPRVGGGLHSSFLHCKPYSSPSSISKFARADGNCILRFH
jgi:hypothetical protein